MSTPPSPVFSLRNLSGASYTGWTRFNLEVPADQIEAFLAVGPRAIPSEGMVLVPAHRDGLDTVTCDLRCSIPSGAEQHLLTESFAPAVFTRGPLPADPIAFFGVPTVAGVPFDLVSCEPDGAAYAIELRMRALGICVTVFARWYPDEPFVLQGELSVVNSDPRDSGTSFLIPMDVDVRFGEAWVQFLGKPVGAPPIVSGTTLADGQGLAFPFIAVWPSHVAGATVEKLQNLSAVINHQIGASGITNLYPSGSPPVPTNAVVTQFMQANYAGAVARLYGWPAGPLGVVARSEDSGEQEDEVFVGGEMLVPEGELVRYLVAFDHLKRPCHFLEADGTQLDRTKHPDLMIFDGRPLWVGRDQLGKPVQPTIVDTHGWWGPDPEHWLLNTLGCAVRTKGSPMLQWILRMQAILYLFSHTTTPRISTTQCFAARAVAWECLAVLDFVRNLRDRALAAEVEARFRARWDLVIKPWLMTFPGDVWDTRTDDARLGAGTRYLAWQNCVCAGTLDLAGEFFAIPEMRESALRGATAMLKLSWKNDASTNRWVSCAQGQTIDGSVDGAANGAAFNESFNYFGMSWAPAVLLRQGKDTSGDATSIWRQLVTEQPSNHWLIPGVPG
jgi:hypothetical protein